MAFAHYPPGNDASLIVRLWDRHLPRWRQVLRKEEVTEPAKNEKLAAEIKNMTKGRPLAPDEIDFDPHDTDSLAIQRFLSKRRGNWWQLPKDLEVTDDE